MGTTTDLILYSKAYFLISETHTLSISKTFIPWAISAELKQQQFLEVRKREGKTEGGDGQAKYHAPFP